jgi:hypothetical protein
MKACQRAGVVEFLGDGERLIGGPVPSQADSAAEPGWLGAELQDLDDASIKALGLKQAHAVLTVLAVTDGPAARPRLSQGSPSPSL